MSRSFLLSLILAFVFVPVCGCGGGGENETFEAPPEGEAEESPDYGDSYGS